MVQGLRRSPFARYVVVPLTLVAWLVGCHKWSNAGAPIDRVARESDPPSQIRVTRSDFSVVVLESPRLEGDTLRGWAPSLLDSVSISLADVRNVEVRKTNWWTTGLLIYLGVGLVFAIFACAAADDDDLFWGDVCSS